MAAMVARPSGDATTVSGPFSNTMHLAVEAALRTASMRVRVSTAIATAGRSSDRLSELSVRR